MTTEGENSVVMPTIVVVAYDRPAALSTLLNDLLQGIYPNNYVKLIISIDRSNVSEVASIAENHQWPFGEKEVMLREHHLGLKEHILACGDLTNKYQSIIILEDDIRVSPYFYQYAREANNTYQDDPHIAGISLYGYSITECTLSPFKPLHNGFSNYFMQFPSSWGQCWNVTQWQGFRNWHKAKVNIDIRLPVFIRQWKKDSWKRAFAAYLLEQDKYFVYPVNSLTSNSGKAGTNYPYQLDIYQVSLQTTQQEYLWQGFVDSSSKYDIHFNLQAESLAKLVKDLPFSDFELDLYSSKDLESIHTKYLYTTKPVSNSITSFSNELSPLELNIIDNKPGKGIHLCLAENAKNVIAKPDFGKRQFMHQQELNGQEGELNKFSMLVEKLRFTLLNRFHVLKRLIFTKKDD